VGLELGGEVGAAGPDDPPVGEDVHPLGDEVVEEALVVGDDQRGAVRAPQRGDAGGHDSQRVDVEARVGLIQHGQAGFEDQHLEDLVAFALPAGEPVVDRTVQQRALHLHQAAFGVDEGEELDRSELLLAAGAALSVERRAQEVHGGHAGDLDGVLEAEEHPRRGPLLGHHGEEVDAHLEDPSCGHLVGVAAGEDVCQGALPRAVRAHHRVDLAVEDFQADPGEDLAVADRDVQVVNEQHQPTAPSRLTDNSRWASTANSIGSSRNTSRQKPFTIIEVASSSGMPRWRA